MFDILLCSNDIQTLSEKVSKCVLGLLYRFFFSTVQLGKLLKNNYRIDRHITLNFTCMWDTCILYYCPCFILHYWTVHAAYKVSKSFWVSSCQPHLSLPISCALFLFLDHTSPLSALLNAHGMPWLAFSLTSTKQ